MVLETSDCKVPLSLRTLMGHFELSGCPKMHPHSIFGIGYLLPPPLMPGKRIHLAEKPVQGFPPDYPEYLVKRLRPAAMTCPGF